MTEFRTITKGKNKGQRYPVNARIKPSYTNQAYKDAEHKKEILNHSKNLLSPHSRWTGYQEGVLYNTKVIINKPNEKLMIVTDKQNIVGYAPNEDFFVTYKNGEWKIK